MEREEITYPLGNSDFLRVLTNSFKEFIEKGTSRSTAKLKPLHAHSCMGGRRFYYPPDTAAFLNDAAAPVMDGSCGAEDYLILQLRLRKGLSLDAYKKLYGKEFSTAQLAFVQNCVRAGYASFDGHTLALTPAGLIVQNSILAQLL